MAFHDFMKYFVPLGFLFLSGCSQVAQESSYLTPPPIIVDQFGYLPALDKIAIIKDPIIGFDAGQSFTPSQRFSVIDQKTGMSVFTGEPKAWNDGEVDDVSGDRVWRFDFSSVRTPGHYVIRDIEQGVDSYEFEVSTTVYKPVLKAAFKTLYLQRAGFEKRPPFVDAAFQDKASHLRKGQDPQARLFNSMNDKSTERDLRGGWYDAGDYNKYTSWTANCIMQLLAAYLENPTVWTDDFGIPESGNGTPDILDEVKWGLDWLERMQNEDGAMLSVMSLASASPPSAAKGSSRYGPPNSSATMTSAGAFAMAAKVYGEITGFGVDSQRYTDRAEKAWRWVEVNPRVKFYNNDTRSDSVGLGAGQQEVEADRMAKKMLISAIHMSALKQDTYYHRVVESIYAKVKPMNADTPNGFEGNMAFDMLYYAGLPATPKAFAKQVKSDYTSNVLNAYNAWPVIKNDKGAYRAKVDGYWWGSNSTKIRRGEVFTQAIQANVGDASKLDYLNAAVDYVHYIHGVNPLNKTYLSNMGELGAENSVTEFYHSWFADGTDWDTVGASKYGPAPGFLVGGANAGYERDSCCDNVCGGTGAKMCKIPVHSPPSGQPPAKSYTDFNEGWPINSWAVTESSNRYQVNYIRLLSKFSR